MTSWWCSSNHSTTLWSLYLRSHLQNLCIKFAMAEKARNPSILLILVALFLLSSGGFELGAAAARVVSGCNAELQHFKEMLGAQKPLLLEERMGKATATKDLTSSKRGGDVPSPGVGHWRIFMVGHGHEGACPLSLHVSGWMCPCFLWMSRTIVFVLVVGPFFFLFFLFIIILFFCKVRSVYWHGWDAPNERL